MPTNPNKCRSTCRVGGNAIHTCNIVLKDGKPHDGPHKCMHFEWTDKGAPGVEVGTYNADASPFDKKAK